MPSGLPPALTADKLLDLLPSLGYVELIPGGSSYPQRAVRIMGEGLSALLGCGRRQPSDLLIRVAVHPDDASSLVDSLAAAVEQSGRPDYDVPHPGP